MNTKQALEMGREVGRAGGLVVLWAIDADCPERRDLLMAASAALTKARLDLEDALRIEPQR